MIPLIQNNIDAIQELCKKHHVQSLYVFGSAINGAFGKNSDVDFLYEIDTDYFEKRGTAGYDYIDNLNDLETGLNRLLSKKIDLVPYRDVHNKYFKQAIDSNRTLVYGNK